MNEDEHYKQRLRDLMRYASHKRDCKYVLYQEKPPCTCGFAALAAIVWAEVGTNDEPVRS
jgi:hypothetical protein